MSSFTFEGISRPTLKRKVYRKYDMHIMAIKIVFLYIIDNNIIGQLFSKLTLIIRFIPDVLDRFNSREARFHSSERNLFLSHLIIKN